ncbi:hypothetical protein AZE42_09101, partial [Rhizopogon vesiculosus]
MARHKMFMCVLDIQ